MTARLIGIECLSKRVLKYIHNNPDRLYTIADLSKYFQKDKTSISTALLYLRQDNLVHYKLIHHRTYFWHKCECKPGIDTISPPVQALIVLGDDN